MTDSPEIFYQRLSQRIVILLAVIMVPALLTSVIRAFNADGAYGVVIVQLLVYSWLVYLALPLSRTSFAVRTYSLVGIGLAVGVGALIRNPDPGVGMAWLIVASVFLSAINTGPARYIFIAAVFPAGAVIAHSAGQLGWMALISHALAMAGMAAVANMLMGGVVEHANERMQEEIKLRKERDEALAELAREQARRDLVASAADIAFLEYDYATGMLDGDRALQRRYGRNVDDGAIDLSSRFDDFPADSLALIQQKIGDMSHQPAGAEETFVHQQHIGEERTVSTFRVTGVNIEREGRLMFMGASIDISSEHKAIEKASRFAAQLDLMAKAGGIGMHTYYPATDMVRFNTFNADAAGRFDISSAEDLLPAAEMRKFLTPDSLKQRYELNEELAQMPVGSVQRFDEHLVGVNGKEMSLRVARVRQKVGTEDVYLSLSVDVTDEMNALEKAKDLSSMIELVSGAGGVGLIEFFPDTRTFKCNPEVSARLGLEHSELERDVELFYAHQTEEIRALFLTPRQALAAASDGELQSFVHPFYLANGEVHYMRVSRVKRELNGRTSFLGLSIDVTDEVQAKEQAEKQAEQLKLITEQGKIGLYEFDLEKGVMYANSVLCERFGVDPALGEISQAVLLDNLTEDARASALEHIEQGKTAPEGYFGTSTVDHIFGDGSVHKIRIFEKLELRQGRPFYVGAGVDVTEEVEAKERAELQAEELRKANEEIRFRTEYLENMLEAAPIPVCLLEGDSQSRNFTFVNKETLRVLGYTKEEMLGQNATEMMFLNDEDRQYYMSKVLESMKSGRPLREEMQLYRKNKVVGNFEFNCTYKMVGEKLYGTLFVLDIDERKQREQMLEEAVQASSQAASRLEQEQDRQAQMYAVIGHELRTPAASLQMMLDDLGEGESLDAALARANIEQLLSVIDTLRAVAQPERMAQATYDDVQIDEMLQQQAQNFQSLATRHGIQLKTDFTGLTIHPVHIQKTLLRQVLSNLIKNALIHSGGTELEVGASGRLLEGERKALRLWIADNGKGVSADKVEKLFEAFVRGSTQAEGTGLGLHICREIIENMGGVLRYESRPEGGACFVIELEVDLAKTDPSKQPKPQANESPLKDMRVLLAEDNKTIQMLTQKMLEKQGAQVAVCNNGKEALEAFEPGKFDLVLSDIFMPEMNGYEFAREVRRVDTKVPLIGLTAATIGKETDEMLAAGASAVLSKPISLSKLLDRLAEIELSSNPA